MATSHGGPRLPNWLKGEVSDDYTTAALADVSFGIPEFGIPELSKNLTLMLHLWERRVAMRARVTITGVI